ncbi:flavin reductase family protein [Roseiconus lacunae]|uniref:Flavin reductase family protein n=1 Tax=Roseiconus lacunae TaxID=2605694 RepID=A0ABT7PKX4_9BACT|nr:flavin reductase family protein [Roseiconus lacunae]MDM4017157.1 flavin reductase family protein [Roseiconus lacunae]
MELDVSELSVQETYLRMVQMITPRPIAWVSTESKDGVANLAPFSFFSGIGANPPTLCFAPANNPDGSPKDTLENIRQTGQFAVNIVSEATAEAMHQSADPVAPEVDEFELVGVSGIRCVKIAVPRVEQAIATMECTLHSTIGLGTGPGGANLVIGNVVYFHLDDALADEKVLKTIGRVGRRHYTKIDQTFQL